MFASTANADRSHPVAGTPFCLRITVLCLRQKTDPECELSNLKQRRLRILIPSGPEYHYGTVKLAGARRSSAPCRNGDLSCHCTSGYACGHLRRNLGEARRHNPAESDFGRLRQASTCDAYLSPNCAASWTKP